LIIAALGHQLLITNACSITISYFQKNSVVVNLDQAGEADWHNAKIKKATYVHIV